MRLITTAGKLRDEQSLSSREEFDRLLNDQFGVVMKNKLAF